jgi:uncharacterized OsmC-like protein
LKANENPAQYATLISFHALSYSALQMHATALALCTTYSVLVAYGENIGIDTQEMVIGMRWSYAEDPYRIGEIAMRVRWPGLPQDRLVAARRAASHCVLHNTLRQPPEVATEIAA